MVLQAEPDIRKVISTTLCTVDRYFTRPGAHPFDEQTWELRTASIADESGTAFFEQKDVEIPQAWSQTATNVVVSKYFRGPLGTERREKSVKQMIARVADTITAWGVSGGYFLTDDEAETFRMELTHLLVNQTGLLKAIFCVTSRCVSSARKVSPSSAVRK